MNDTEKCQELAEEYRNIIKEGILLEGSTLEKLCRSASIGLETNDREMYDLAVGNIWLVVKTLGQFLTKGSDLIAK